MFVQKFLGLLIIPPKNTKGIIFFPVQPKPSISLLSSSSSMYHLIPYDRSFCNPNSSRGKLIDISAHAIKFSLARRDQIADLAEIRNGLVPLELVAGIVHRLMAAIGGDLVDAAQNCPPQ